MIIIVKKTSPYQVGNLPRFQLILGALFFVLIVYPHSLLNSQNSIQSDSIIESSSVQISIVNHKTDLVTLQYAFVNLFSKDILSFAFSIIGENIGPHNAPEVVTKSQLLTGVMWFLMIVEIVMH